MTSKYQEDIKSNLPQLSQELKDISIGMILGDASIQRPSREAFIKFEQGYKQKEFIDHLFLLYNTFCFTKQVKIRTQPTDRSRVKSYYFRTYALPQFSKLYTLFFSEKIVEGSKKKKAIFGDLITKRLTPQGLAYGIMCDGSLDGKTMILHTQSFTKQENEDLVLQLNSKFNLNSKVTLHKSVYSVITIPHTDAYKLSDLIGSYLMASMFYKLPIKN